MVIPKHIAMIKKGAEFWNAWRKKNNIKKPELAQIDLSGYDFQNVNLHGANLKGAKLTGCNLEGADLGRCDLREADLGGVTLMRANLKYADLRHARLKRANLWRCNLTSAKLDGANLYKADLAAVKAFKASFFKANLYRVNFTAANLTEANLSGALLKETSLVAARLVNTKFMGANLSEASLVRSNIEGADFTGSRIYGLGVWDIQGEVGNQEDLIITKEGTNPILLDNLKLAQFIYLLLDNAQVREAIDTLTSKVVLILGRFSEDRKPILDAMRIHLRELGLMPVLFDFSIPSTRDVSETVRIIAGMARFVIADVTDATEVRAELHYVVPSFPSLPVKPIIATGAKEFVSLSGHLNQYPWLLPTFEYRNTQHLLKNLRSQVIAPAMDFKKLVSGRKRRRTTNP